MAEKIKEWPQWRAPRASKYPWDEWFDGSMWILRQGEDFSASPERMRQMIGVAARHRKLKVKTSVNKQDNRVALQVVGNI